jgi:hypothetical protein
LIAVAANQINNKVKRQHHLKEICHGIHDTCNVPRVSDLDAGSLQAARMRLVVSDNPSHVKTLLLHVKALIPDSRFCIVSRTLS